MSLKLPKTIARADILKAIMHLNRKGEHPFAESTRYDLLFRMRRYAPKAVIGVAASLVTGKQYTPYDFAGGLKSQCFRLLRDAGFTVVTKDDLQLCTEEVDPNEAGFEGAVTRVTVNRYERDRKARRDCILHHGTRCSVCRVDLGVVYGAVGKGFTHVHHLTPISTIKRSYRIKGARDLRPVCPNCHAMLHRKAGDPFTIEELREMMEKPRPGSRRRKVARSA